MTTTAAAIASASGTRLFWVLKVSGLPYIFVGGEANPYDSRWGAGAWDAGGATVARGMALPSDPFAQELKDVSGGIATAESVVVGLRDVEAWDTSGRYHVLGRAFASGAHLSATRGTLRLSVLPTVGVGDLVEVDTPTALTWPESGTLHVGTEAISYSARVAIGKRAMFTISGRNVYPCHTSYPPIPYHRVELDSAGKPKTTIMVTSTPVTIIGRAAALYVGHIEATGVPCAEADALCRIVGRIVRGEWNNDACSWQVEIESVMAGLENATVAGNLVSASVVSDQYLFTADYTCRFFLGLADAPYGQEFEIDPGTYDADGLCSTVNNAIVSRVNAGLRRRADGKFEFFRKVPGDLTESGGFRIDPVAFRFWVSGSKAQSSTTPTIGLLSALGFDESDGPIESVLAGNENVITAQKIASAYVPITTRGSAAITVAITNAGDVAAALTDQRDGGGKAYVRCANGATVECLSVSTTNGTITLGKSAGEYGSIGLMRSGNLDWVVTPGAETMEQVLLPALDGSTRPKNVVQVLGSLIGSTGYGSTDYDYWPPGVGLGLVGLMETESWGAIQDEPVRRYMQIDRSTTFGELLNPVAKELGFYVSWNPATGKIALRKAAVPGTGKADATFSFSESNRPRTTDTSRAVVDRTNLRHSWTVRWGWDWGEQKFTGQDLTFVDGWVLSVQGQSDKAEVIEDKTMRGFSSERTGKAQLFTLLETRARLTRYPWLRISRTVNKRGLLLCPGSVYRIVDRTVHNPFTGARGIGADDNIVGILTRVSSNLATGEAEVDLAVSTGYPPARTWSPSGLVTGYNSGTGVLTMGRRYTGHATASDGIDFAVGDKVRVRSHDCAGAPAYLQTSTITAVAADGTTVTVGAGLPAMPAGEHLLLLQPYNAATASRRANVAWLADGDTLSITTGVVAQVYS